jgi:hypothetical protein
MEPETHEAYCVKCKAKKIAETREVTTMKNGALMAKGDCPVCGTTICRIMAKPKS